MDENETILLVTGNGPDVTGGFYAVERRIDGTWAIEELDRVSSCGIIVEGGLIFRVLSSLPGAGSSAELLAYDESGVVSYRRIDGLVDPHGIAWTGTHFAIPCPPENGVALLDRFGEISEWIRLPGHGDAWHVNGITVRAGRLYATAFGRYETERGWDSASRNGAGIVFAVEDLTVLAHGLNCPHNPVFLGEGLIICDSGNNRLVAIDERTNDVTAKVDLGGWTRGLAIGDTTFAVGISGQRYGAEVQLAELAIVDRVTWKQVDRIGMPCQEIQTVVRVPRTFLSALRRGFRTNAMRTAVQDRAEIYRQIGNIHPQQPMTPMPALDPDEARITFAISQPGAVAPGERFSLDVSVSNNGPRWFMSAMPYPVYVGYRWMWDHSSEEAEALDERRCALPEPIAPGMSRRFPVSLTAPSAPGSYRLRITLVQEWIRWFDAEDPTMGAELRFSIGSPGYTVANEGSFARPTPM